jgi:hypothetical protein
MYKLTKRKGFNFFRSYYDVYNELETDKDKVNFINALLDRQFLGVKPTDLKGMAKFAYISQTNSIDSQVKGYEDKTGTSLSVNTTPPTVGVNKKDLTPTVQVQVQEKVEVKDIHREFDHLSITKIDYEKLCIEYESKVVDRVLDNIENFGSNKKYKNLYFTAKNWLAKEPKRKTVELKEKEEKGTWSMAKHLKSLEK